MAKEMPDMFGELTRRISQTKQADSSEAPTNADNVSESPTTADNASETPTDAEDSELVRVSGRVVRWQRDALEKIAKREGRLLSDVLREAIRDFLRGRG